MLVYWLRKCHRSMGEFLSMTREQRAFVYAMAELEADEEKKRKKETRGKGRR